MIERQYLIQSGILCGMRLYLSSYRIGDAPKELLALVGKGRRVLVIMNALDSIDKQERSLKLTGEKADLNKLGFQTEELDLRDYFSNKNKEELINSLSQTDLLWVRGGNIFVLMRAMHQSGFDKLVPELLKKDSFTYGGYSAGAIALTGSLKGLELVDNPNDIPEGYESKIVWNGIGLVDFSIAPHYKSDHRESEAIERVIKYYKKHNVPYKALRDGQVIVIHDDKIKLTS